MKSYIYHILSTLLTLTLVSCAEEGPFNGGVLESEIKVEQITSTTAVISITYPQTANQILESMEDEYYHSYIVPSGTAPNYSNNDNSQRGTFSGSKSTSENVTCFYSFSGLNPDSSYDFIARSYAKVHGEKDPVIYEDKPFTFKTSKPLDYSELGKITCTLGEKCPYPFINVTLTLPEGLYICDHYSEDYIVDSEINIYVSSNPQLYDYKHVYESMMGNKNRKINFKLDIDESIENLYFRITGDFFYEPYQLWFRDINIDIPEPLVITKSDFTPLVAETAFAGSDFSIIKFSLPDYLPDSYYFHDPKVLYSTSSELSDAKECETSIDGSYQGSLFFSALVPQKIDNGQKLFFNITSGIHTGDYSNIHSSHIKSEMVFNPENALVQNPSVKTVFSGNDKTFLEFNYPEGLYGNNPYEEEVFSFILSPDMDFSSTETTSIIKSNNQFLVLDTSDISIHNYIRIKGPFNILGFNFKDISLDFSEKIDKNSSHENILNLTKSEEKDGVLLTLTCAKGFFFERSYCDPYIRCYNRYGNNQFTSSSIESQLFENKIVFKIPTRIFNDLTKGHEYTIIIFGFSLKHADSDMRYNFQNDPPSFTMIIDSSNVSITPSKSNMSKINNPAMRIRR